MFHTTATWLRVAQRVAGLSQCPRGVYRTAAAACLHQCVTPTCRHSTEPRPMSEIPGPPRYPLLGSLPNYFPIVGSYDMRYLDESQLRKREQYGPIIQEELVPGKNFVMLFDPDDIEAFYRQEGLYPVRMPFDPSVAWRHKRGLPGALTTESSPEEWHRVRAAVNKSALSPRVVSSYLPRHSLISDQLVTLICHLRNNKGEVDGFHNVLRRWSMESIGVVLFEEHLGTLQPDLSPQSEAQQFIDAGVTLFSMTWQCMIYWFIHKYQMTKEWRLFEESADKILATSKHHVDALIKRLDENPDQLVDSFLAKLVARDDLSYDDIIVLMSDFFAAGVDTTSNTMGFALYQLALNPEKAEIARQQITQVVPPGEDITPEMMTKLPYVKGIVKEALRLHPVVNSVPRITVKDTVIRGYLIPTNTNVLLSPAIAGQEEQYFEAAHEFRPERWLRGQQGEASHHPFATLPFGHGPRMCIGRRFAEQELYTGITKILANFSLAYPYDKLRSVMSLVNIPDKPLLFQFTAE